MPENDQDDPRSRGSGPPTAEAALDELRRRYNLLRGDYETLMNRLRDLEQRAQPRPAQPVAAGGSSAFRFGIAEQALMPLTRLRNEYVETISVLQAVVTSLPTGPVPPTPADPAGPVAGTSSRWPNRIQVEAKSESVPRLMQFREQIAGLPGVRAVNIQAADRERATLLVELD